MTYHDITSPGSPETSRAFDEACKAYYAFRATKPGTTAEEETYLRWIELGDKLTRLDRQMIRASWRDDARMQGK